MVIHIIKPFGRRQPMAIDDIISVYIERIALGGEGLALSEGRRIFVPLSAPGERIKARIIEEHGSGARAELLEIETCNTFTSIVTS